MGMGKKGFCYPGAKCLVSRSSLPLLILFAFSTVVQIVGSQVHTPQCRIQKCTTDFVSLTSHLNAALDGFDTEFCKALRAYSACTQRTAKSCRGNLVFHSAVLGISDLMSQRNCSKDGPTSPTHPEMPIEPCNYHSRHQQQLFQQQQASWLGVGGAGAGSGATVRPPTYLFCGLFGDPHLRTFKDHFQTCKVEGAWPLIDNNYLSVQVTNVPVVLGSSATATNKITIIFKPYQDCTDQKVYQAVTDDLPAAFVDGTISGGEGEPKSLWVIEKSPGHHVEIHAAYIGVTVIVRQLGRYLTLAARVPEEMAMAYDETQDLQLCVNGCPSAERIDRDGHLPLPLQQQAGMRHQHHNHHHHHHNNHNQPHHLAPQQQYQQQTQFHHSHHHQLPRPSAQRAIYSLEAAMARCSEQLEVEDIYFHSCVFDLLTTGDANFTMAAHDALRDMKALHPRKEHWHIFPSSGASATHQQGPPLVSFALFCLLITSLLC